MVLLWRGRPRPAKDALLRPCSLNLVLPSANQICACHVFGRGIPPPDLTCIVQQWERLLRGRELALALSVVAGRIGPAVKARYERLGAVPESGVKKGDVGLNGPGEMKTAPVLKALFKDVVLCEWYAARRSQGSCPFFRLSDSARCAAPETPSLRDIGELLLECATKTLPVEKPR